MLFIKGIRWKRKYKFVNRSTSCVDKKNKIKEVSIKLSSTFVVDVLDDFIKTTAKANQKKGVSVTVDSSPA
jgi:hypothetical protein